MYIYDIIKLRCWFLKFHLLFVLFIHLYHIQFIFHKKQINFFFSRIMKIVSFCVFFESFVELLRNCENLKDLVNFFNKSTTFGGKSSGVILNEAFVNLFFDDRSHEIGFFLLRNKRCWEVGRFQNLHPCNKL